MHKPEQPLSPFERQCQTLGLTTETVSLPGGYHGPAVSVDSEEVAINIIRALAMTVAIVRHDGKLLIRPAPDVRTVTNTVPEQRPVTVVATRPVRYNKSREQTRRSHQRTRDEINQQRRLAKHQPVYTNGNRD